MSREVEVVRGRGWWENRGGLVDDLVKDLVGDRWCRGRWGVLDGDVGGGVVEDVDDMGRVGWGGLAWRGSGGASEEVLRRPIPYWSSWRPIDVRRVDGGDIWGVVRPWRGVGLLLDNLPGLGGVARWLVDDDGSVGLGDVAGRRGRGEANDLVLAAAVVLGLRLHLDLGVLFILHLGVADVLVAVIVFVLLTRVGGEA